MVPRQYQSGITDRRGRITKRGPRLLRTLLLECAWCSLRYNQWSQETYERIHAGKRPRKKKAAIALARKILVIAWAMMRDEVDYDPDRNLEPTLEQKETQAA
jgi:transposase